LPSDRLAQIRATDAAQNQLRFLEKEPTAKKLLYVLRTTTTGIHLLATGELEADLTRLMDRYSVPDAAASIRRSSLTVRGHAWPMFGASP
jgi:predicted nucleotidyltransferase